LPDSDSDVQPALDVIIPSFNNLANLKRCLLSLSAPKQDYPAERYRLIVCVDGSTDGTQSWLKNIISGEPVADVVQGDEAAEEAETGTALRSTRIILWEHADGGNHGRNATRNLALEVINADRIIFLDSDMRVQPDFLQAHVTPWKDADDREIRVGKISYTNADENLWAAYLQRRGAGKFGHGEPLPYYYLVTGNSSMPAEAFKEVGGQDAAMRTYGGGDTEFAIRLHKEIGLPLRYNARAEAFSDMEKDLRFALQQMIEFGGINLPYILEKHPGHDQLFNVRRMLSPGFKGCMLRFGLSQLPESLPESILRALSPNMREMLIKSLVAGNIYKGFARSGIQKTLQKMK
jgi:cellulose synthase/poly-beta-1,6-N-acetylglucosamine synthase-like glycosyltransferase